MPGTAMPDAQPVAEMAGDRRRPERAAIAAGRAWMRAPGTGPIVSMGSTPTALHAAHLEGVTEVRAGVYMFGDLFQMQIGSHGLEEIALTVLSSVIGRRPADRRLLVDAGGMALSKDRSTEAAPVDYGFGLVLDSAGHPALGGTVVRQAYQEHGVVDATRAALSRPAGRRQAADRAQPRLHDRRRA